MRRNFLSVDTIALFAFCLATPASLLGEGDLATNSNQQVGPPDVFVRVQLLATEVDLIRQELGCRKADAPLFQVRNAAPREVYYQATTLFTKCNRLAFDILRNRIDPPASPAGEIQPANVLALVNAALGRVRDVKRRLSIVESVSPAAIADEKTPSDVFFAIMSVNRQLNLLIQQRFTPADVYAVVSACVYHASRLERTEVRDVIPDVAPIRRKRPEDVFLLMNECYQLVFRLSLKLGYPAAESKLTISDDSTVNPSDVHDISSLVLSEIAFLDYQLNDGDSTPDIVRYGGYKIPSDCFRRASVLRKQLEFLNDRIR